jgi:hypothetical protein
MDLANIIIILLLVVLIIVFMSHLVVINNKPNPPSPPPTRPMVGGCGGTRYGCCSNSGIPKLNRIGTNCRYQ